MLKGSAAQCPANALVRGETEVVLEYLDLRLENIMLILRICLPHVVFLVCSESLINSYILTTGSQ